MDPNRLKSIIEGLIFVHTYPLSVNAIAQAIPDVNEQAIQSVIDDLEQEYRSRARGFALVKAAGGYQFRSLPELAPWILEMKKTKPARLSRASLETLSIIAYNQPITRSRVERIRGVESSGIIRKLLERGLVESVGRKDIPGRPLLYGTTRRFLEVFGLQDLASLPPLPEIEELEEEPEDLNEPPVSDQSDEPGPRDEPDAGAELHEEDEHSNGAETR